MVKDLWLTALKYVLLFWLVPIVAFVKDVTILSNIIVNLVKSKHSIIFACNRYDLWMAAVELLRWNQLVYPVNFESNFSLTSILSTKNYAKTAIVVDCDCNSSRKLIYEVSANRYFNRTYQWLLFDYINTGIENVLPLEVDYLGPNAQVIYINGSENSSLFLWDVHSKGRHLHSPLECRIFGEKVYTLYNNSLIIHNDLMRLQGVNGRQQFNGLTLRGATVIDQNNIFSNAEIEKVLSQPSKDAGVAAFTKYHYVLLQILREYFNFTVNFRNARGWASRLGKTEIRLGFLGIMMRNEADIGASGAFNRINRFAEFDTIHQGWKFETAFLYRFTPILNMHGKSGNFLAPFTVKVWFFSFGTLLVINLAWSIITWFKYKPVSLPNNPNHCQNNIKIIDNEQQQKNVSACMTKSDIPIKEDNTGLPLNICAAICQQGMEPIPKGLASRIIVLTIFLFSLVMYNYYTSSVVGGLLSTTAQGPSSVNDIIYSSLKLAFEDIGYYKVLFRNKLFDSSIEECHFAWTPSHPVVSCNETDDELHGWLLKWERFYESNSLRKNRVEWSTLGYTMMEPKVHKYFANIFHVFEENKSPVIGQLLLRKLQPERSLHDLPVYTHIENAIPYIKNGTIAFHCEVVDAYPVIAQNFDANEICDLRIVSGLMETEVMNWVIHKNSQYTEIFRIVMSQAREIGLIEHLLRQRQPKKPACQSLYTVYPVNFSSVISAFAVLSGCWLADIISGINNRN